MLSVELSDDLERPEHEDVSEKMLDPYQDSNLLHFFKYGRHGDGISKKQHKRVERLVRLFKLKDDTLFYRNVAKDNEFNLIVPKIEERLNIIAEAHNLGHFKLDSV